MIATFFPACLLPVCHAAAPVQTIHSCPTHNCTWIGIGLVQCMLVWRETRQDLYWPLFRTFCCCLFGHLFNVVVGGFDTRSKLFGWIKVLVDLVGNFCSFSESMRRVCTSYIFSSNSTLYFRQFTRSLVSHAYVYAAHHRSRAVIVMCTCTQKAVLSKILFVRKFLWSDVKSQNSCATKILDQAIR